MNRIKLEMVSDREGVTEKGVNVTIGTTVTYLAHVSGGMIRVRFINGDVDVMHPHCFKELR